jgi:ATP-binding cassette, subfamily C (CFTR/MRP), member 4
MVRKLLNRIVVVLEINFFVYTFRSLLFLWVCMRSSIKLHNQMFSNILTATMRFFDTNPSGRIMNRFSKDMGVVDEILPRMYLDGIQVIIDKLFY